MSELSKGEADRFFESLWQAYPRKLGKGQVSLAKKKKLYAVGFDEMLRCIDRYRAYCDSHGIEEKYIMYGSTFFNSGYVDYLDENHIDQNTASENLLGDEYQ